MATQMIDARSLKLHAYYWVKTSTNGWVICKCELDSVGINTYAFVMLGIEDTAYLLEDVIAVIPIETPQEVLDDNTSD